MKTRLRFVSVLLAMVCLVGCASTPVTPPVTTDFTCQASIRYREMDLVAQLTRCTDGGLEVAFSLPKSLAGITLGWDGSEMWMELGGVRLALPEEKVPEGALVRCLLQVLAAEHNDGVETEDGCVFSGEVDGMAYELVCDPATGMPRSLALPDEELTAVFTSTKRITE